MTRRATEIGSDRGDHGHRGQHNGQTRLAGLGEPEIIRNRQAEKMIAPALVNAAMIHLTVSRRFPRADA